jgi:hypothetical protein
VFEELPVNHRLRPFYRVLAALAGLYVLVFGIAGYARTKGTPAFSRDHVEWVLGLRTNLGFATLSVVAGAVLLAATLIGRNVDRTVNLVASGVFLGAGLVMLALLRTDLNFLGFSVVNCVVSFVIGSVLLTAGLYGKVHSGREGAPAA